MKKSFINSLYIVSIAVVIGLGVNVVSAVWLGPTQNPPGGNVSSPLNAGDTLQEKRGNLLLNSSTQPFLIGLYVYGTGAIVIPSGDTSQRTGINDNAMIGAIRVNTETQKFEVYLGTSVGWKGVNLQ